MTTLYTATVDGNSSETTEDLGDDVGCRRIRGDTTVIQGHDGYGRVEVTTTDGTAEKNKDGQRTTNHPPGTGGNDDGQKNEGAQELNEDSEDVHLADFLFRVLYIIKTPLCRE